MARTEHYKKSQLRKVVNEHDRRQTKYKNNVDLTRSKDNYTYGVSDPAECVQTVNKRVQEIMDGRNLQTQTSVATEWVITLPKELSGRDHEFFDEAWQFCSDRYGEKNMIAGYVHMDEDRPHMHLLFVPEATSRKTGRKTVSSASLMTKTELSKFHDDFDRHCERAFGKAHLIRNGKTVGDKMSVSDLKDMQTQVESQYKAEIASYRAFMASMHTKDGRSLLEVYEAKQSAPATPKAKPDIRPQTLSDNIPEMPYVKHAKRAGKVKPASTCTMIQTSSPKVPNAYCTDYAELKRQAERALQARALVNDMQDESDRPDYTR